MPDVDVFIDDQNWRIRASSSSFVTTRLLINAVNDIAKEVEEKAREFAPLGEPPPQGSSRAPGTLKREGIIRHEARRFSTDGGDEGLPGEVVTNIPAFHGRGFIVRGGNPLNRGQFSSASLTRPPGFVFRGFRAVITNVEAEVELNPLVEHAKWVHEGTGIYGPFHRPITPRVAPYLVFHWHGRRFSKKSVRGQPPQPFLTEAYVYVNNVYAPVRLSQLRAELGIVA